MNLDLFESGERSGGADGSVSEDPLPPEPTVWTVSQVNQAVRALLEDALPPLWVSGEVANWKRAASGHCYFSLKDDFCQLRCVMWRGQAARLPMDPEDGMRIRVFGQLTLYEARGEYQLSAQKLEADEGEGLWKMAFDHLRQKLETEGLLRPELRRPLPRFPRTVGVVTSPTGAALHDILTVLRRRAPWVRVLIRGARVQGEGAADEIAAAVRLLGGSGLVDVLIVGRGGGSLEDLWAFNEESVARAVAACPVPVVSAVGHEVDITISDLVADLRAPTPSAAAEAVAPDKEELHRYLAAAGRRLARGLRRRVEVRKRALLENHRRLRRAGGEVVAPRRRRLNDATGRQRAAIRSSLKTRRHTLHSLRAQLDALSPLSTLRRGYAVPLTEGGTVLRGVDDFTAGDPFLLRLADGRVHCETKRVEKDEVQGEG